MSPEQARGDSVIAPASDLYSLGVMLYEMLIGRVPISGDNYNQLMYRVMIGEYTPPRAAPPRDPRGARAADRSTRWRRIRRIARRARRSSSARCSRSAGRRSATTRSSGSARSRWAGSRRRSRPRRWRGAAWDRRRSARHRPIAAGQATPTGRRVARASIAIVALFLIARRRDVPRLDRRRGPTSLRRRHRRPRPPPVAPAVAQNPPPAVTPPVAVRPTITLRFAITPPERRRSRSTASTPTPTRSPCKKTTRSTTSISWRRVICRTTRTSGSTRPNA